MLLLLACSKQLLRGEKWIVKVAWKSFICFKFKIFLVRTPDPFVLRGVHNYSPRHSHPPPQIMMCPSLSRKSWVHPWRQVSRQTDLDVRYQCLIVIISVFIWGGIIFPLLYYIIFSTGWNIHVHAFVIFSILSYVGTYLF